MISVITPALHPDSRLLQAAARSLDEQVDPPPFEWVVVAQRDERQIANAICSKRTFPTRVISFREALGPSLARNIALLGAEGHWICPLDSDDELPATTLRDLGSAANADGSTAWVVGSGVTFGSKHPDQVWVPELPEGRVEKGLLADSTRLSGYLPSIPVAGLYRRDVLERVGGWPALPRDEDSYVKLAVSSIAPGRCIPSVTYRYRRDVPHQLTTGPRFEAQQEPSRRLLLSLLSSVVGGRNALPNLASWRRFITTRPV